MIQENSAFLILVLIIIIIIRFILCKNCTEFVFTVDKIFFGCFSVNQGVEKKKADTKLDLSLNLSSVKHEKEEIYDPYKNRTVEHPLS